MPLNEFAKLEFHNINDIHGKYGLIVLSGKVPSYLSRSMILR